MALVFGSLVGSASGALLALWWRPHKLAWPSSFETIGGALHVGWHIVVGRLAWYTYNTADFAVVHAAGANSVTVPMSMNAAPMTGTLRTE